MDKIDNADKFIILDTVKFKKKHFENRNKIRTKEGEEFIRVNVKKHKDDELIKNIQISYEQDWIKRYLNILKNNYSKTKYYDKYFNGVKKILERRYTYLCDLNVVIIKKIMEWFDIHTETTLASELNLPTLKGGTNVNLEICKKNKANIYLSGPHGKDYLDLQKFKNNKIKVEFHNFIHPEYKQNFSPFIPNMCALDLLFNYGEDAKSVLFRNKGMKRILLKLKKFGIQLNKMDGIELFGRDGGWQTVTYANKLKSLEVWEIDLQFKEKLKKNLPNAKIKFLDSINEIKTKSTKELGKYNFIVIDNPQNCYGEYCEHFDVLKNISKLINKEAIIIFNINLHPFNYEKNQKWKSRRNKFYNNENTANMDIKFLLEFYENYFNNLGFDTEFKFNVEREAHEDIDYLHYLVFKIRRKEVKK